MAKNSPQKRQKIDVTLAPSIVVVCGQSGSGKSLWVKRRIAAARRVSIWDPDDEYAAEGCLRITSAKELIRAMGAAGARRSRLCFVAPPAGFGLWARATFAWGHCVAVAEELAGVTSPGKAPPGWHVLVSRGRKRAIEIIGVTQRPSESDKTIMGNSTLIHCGMLARAQDRAYMAKELDISLIDIAALAPLQYVERDRKSRKLQKGRVQV